MNVLCVVAAMAACVWDLLSYTMMMGGASRNGKYYAKYYLITYISSGITWRKTRHISCSSVGQISRRPNGLMARSRSRLLLSDRPDFAPAPVAAAFNRRTITHSPTRGSALGLRVAAAHATYVTRPCGNPVANLTFGGLARGSTLHTA